MLTILYYIVILLSLLLLLVIVHEFGHFCIAKLFGIKVQRFSIGFGKFITSVRSKKGTEYGIAPILLGGYVKLLDSREGKIKTEDQGLAFDQHPIYQRFLVLIAGSVFNLLFAFLLFWLVFTYGIVYIKPVVNQVMKDSPAAAVGIKTGDEVLAVGKYQTLHWAQVAMALVRYYGEKGSVSITLKNEQQLLKNAQIRTVQIPLQSLHLDNLRPNPLKSLGVSPLSLKTIDSAGIRAVHYPFWQAFLPALTQTYDFVTFNGLVLYKMLTGVISLQSIAGPLGILEGAVLAAKQGVIIYLNFLALLSISLAVVNLLPIPGLDGGQIVYLIIEKIRGKPLSNALQELIFRLSFIIIALIIVQVFVNDLQRLPVSG